MEECKYVTIKYEIDAELYKAAQEKLSSVGCNVNQYCVLCLLKGARYYKEIPACADMKSDELIDKIVSDVIEELVLLYLNRDENNEENDVHK